METCLGNPQDWHCRVGEAMSPPSGCPHCLTEWMINLSSFPGNKETDTEIWEAASCSLLFCPLYYRDLYPTVQSTLCLYSVWQNRQDSLTASTKTRKLMTKVVHPWSYSHTRGHGKEAIQVHLGTGHISYTYGFLMSQGVKPYCDDCLFQLTLQHLLVECPSKEPVSHGGVLHSPWCQWIDSLRNKVIRYLQER